MPILHWLNDQEARKTSSQIPYRLLEAENNLSFGDPNSENMLIQGDNLDALKALLPYFANQIKCIYIDPPYNTRSAFDHYDDNLEHSTWLSIMYPRLELIRQLLSDDGSLWISIDDNESHYLKILMDEIFGRKNFIATIIWQKIYTVKNSARHFSDMHDYILVYAKSSDNWTRKLLPRSGKLDESYSNQDNDPRGAWTTNAVQARNFYSQGQYEIASPSGKKITPPAGTYWRVSKENFEDLDRDNRIWWGKNGNNIPRIKKFLSEVKQGVVPATLWFHGDVGQNAEAKTEVRNIFSEAGEIFLTPKPERLIQRILTITTNEGDLVLDSFLGSGTTSAVAHKMGRRYIGIEMGEHAITHCIPRMKKVVEGEQGGISKDVNWKGGGGFNFYRLGETVFDEQGQINPKVKFKTLAAHVWFSETHTPLSKTPETPLLGVHNETALYLLFNGILGDKTQEGGNVLTARVLRQLPKHEGKKVIYGEMCMLDETSLLKQEITFKHIPYDIKAR
jgi:adenine-specific DNA-methyltransferase